jgi:hypothetical protein
MASLEKASVEDLAKAVATATVTAQRELRAEERPIEIARSSRVSAYNPTGGPRPSLKRTTVFCGAEQSGDSLTNEEIELFNRLQAGRYNLGKWQVLVREDGMAETYVEVKLPTATLDQRMEMPASLVAILSKIVHEADEKRAAKPAA